jgi:hypothetical protein
MGAPNREARALALEAARRHFIGLPVYPSGDKEADRDYWAALKRVRAELRRAGHGDFPARMFTTYGLSALRKERTRQGQQEAA